MPIVSVEKLSELSPERYSAIMQRSMAELGDVYEDVRAICADIRARGDAVTLEHYRKLKEDITVADLKATRGEIEAAYNQVPTEVVEHLKFTADNITRFHRAVERDMWSIEIARGSSPGAWRDRWTRRLLHPTAGRRATPRACS